MANIHFQEYEPIESNWPRREKGGCGYWMGTLIVLLTLFMSYMYNTNTTRRK